MNQTDEDTGTWAKRVFGDADLGDVRRTQRLVVMTAAAARAPHAHLTEVFPTKLHTAYDFVENDAVSPRAMTDALGASTARACGGMKRVYVATDGSSLSVTDNTLSKKTGRVGSTSQSGRGDKVHTALAIDELGAPIGLIDMQSWRRTGPSKTAQRDMLPVEEKETQRWLDARQSTRTRLAAEAPGVRPHFVHDREADAWPILLDAWVHRETEDSTIRASWDRRIVPTDEGEDERPFVRRAMGTAPIVGTYELNVTAGVRRTARKAHIQVRAARVVLRLRDKKTRDTHNVPTYAVSAREVGTTPINEKPIEWILYTTQTVASLDDALVVIRGYAYRWRIEEFHRAWKSGGAGAEETQLVGDNRTRWMIILAAVVVRAVRLTHIARTDPERDAAAEFTPIEVNTVRRVLAQLGRKLEPMTVRLMVRTIANIGGYVPQKSNPQPGTQTLLRGLKRLEDLVRGQLLPRLDQ